MKSIYQEIPPEVAVDLYTRWVAYQQKEIEKNDVLANTASTIKWLESNDHQDQIEYYEDFMHLIAD